MRPRVPSASPARWLLVSVLAAVPACKAPRAGSAPLAAKPGWGAVTANDPCWIASAIPGRVTTSPPVKPIGKPGWGRP